MAFATLEMTLEVLVVQTMAQSAPARRDDTTACEWDNPRADEAAAIDSESVMMTTSGPD